MKGLVNHHEEAISGRRGRAFDDADVLDQEAAIVLENMGDDDQSQETD